MQNIEILGSYYTLAVGMDPFGERHCPHNFKARVAAAAKAGLTGMGLLYEDLVEVRKTHSLREIRLILDDHGIKHVELELLAGWYLDGAARAASDTVRAGLLEASEALGARQIKVADPLNEVAGPDRLVAELRTLCTEAMSRGATILFEVLPPAFSQITSLDAAVDMVRAVGLPNVGLTLDILQLNYMGVSNAEIAEKAKGLRNLSVELSDGFLTKPKNYMDWILNKRLMPGDGEFDTTGFLTAVRDAGYRGPISVEVLNAYVRQFSLETAALMAYQKGRAAADKVDWN